MGARLVLEEGTARGGGEGMNPRHLRIRMDRETGDCG